MNINFDSQNNYVLPTLSLYYRDRTTFVGVIGDFTNLTITPRLNTTSQLQFTMKRLYFSTTQGENIENPLYNKIKKGMLINTTETDNLFCIPCEWDEDNKVSKRKFLGVNWWIITSIEQSIGSEDNVVVTADSYDHTLYERKITIGGDAQNNKTTVKLTSPYVCNFYVPESWNYISIGVRDNSGTKIEINLTAHIDLDKFGQFEEEASRFENDAAKLVKWLVGEKNSSGVYKNGVFDNYIVSTWLTIDYNHPVGTLKDILIFLNNLIWHDTTTNTYYPNNKSLIDDTNERAIDQEYHISIDIWTALDRLIRQSHPLWSFGYVSPSLKELYRIIEGTTTNVYSFIQEVVCKRFECFCITDVQNRKINFYTQEDLFVNNSDVLLSYQNLITEAQINTSDKEPISTMYVHSANTDDYSVGLINPLATNQIYNFSGFKNYFDENMKSQINIWEKYVSGFEKLFQRLGTLRLYYIQTCNYYQAELQSALDEYNSVVDQIKAYKASKICTYTGDIDRMTIKILGSHLVIIPYFKAMIDEGGIYEKRIVETGLTKSQFNDTSKISYVDISLSHFTDPYAEDSLRKLSSAIFKYYRIRKHYYSVLNRKQIVNCIAELVYNVCKMNKVTQGSTELTNLLNKKHSCYDYFDGTTSKIIFKNVSLVQFFNYLKNDNYNQIITSDFVKNTYLEGSTTVLIPKFGKYFGKVWNTSDSPINYVDKTILTQEQIDTLQYYIIEGTYTDENVSFEDLDDKDNTRDVRYNSSKEITDQLVTLYNRAKINLKSYATQEYDFNINVANMLMSSELSLKNNENVYTERLYIGSTINAEIKPNQWETPVVLEITLDYDNPSELSITCSNNYREKPLSYRFEKLYNTLPISSGINTDYNSDWFDT